MVGAPGNECPVGAMPEAADQENDEGVADDLGLGATASSQGDVEIVPEPGGEGDVPSTPEFGDIAAEVGNVEVSLQADAEEFGGADGDVAIAGEIAVNLEGEEDGREQQRAAVLVLPAAEHLVYVERAVVCDDYFLEQAPEHLAAAVHRRVVVEFARALELGQQVCGAFDGTGNELREEADEGEEGDGVACGGKFGAIDVYGVAQGLEGVEADADRQDDVQENPVRIAAKEGPGEGCREEIVVLEYAEDEQVDGDVAGILTAFAAPCFPRLRYFSIRSPLAQLHRDVKAIRIRKRQSQQP